MRFRFITAILLITLLASALPVLAQDTSFTVVTTASLRVRAQPSVDSPALQTAPQGTTLQVFGRNNDGSWLQVGYKGVIGWISVFYTTSTFPVMDLPIVDATVPNPDRLTEQVSAPDGTIVQSGTLVVFSAFNVVNVYASPLEDSTLVVAQLLPNERATVTSLFIDSVLTRFGLVNVNGVQGWIPLYTVNVLGDIRTVAVIGDPNSGAPVPVPGSNVFSLEQRAAVQRAQTHLGRFLPLASQLIDIMNQGANGGIITCGPALTFFASYRPTRRDLELVPELALIRNDMNAAFRDINLARARWLTVCGSDGTLVNRAPFVGWLATAQSGGTKLADVQARLSVLSAR